MATLYQSHLKRFIDLLLSGVALCLVSPLLLLVACLIKLDDQGPVFYGQERLGLGGQIIQIYKFRSMTHRPQRKPGEAGELFGQNSEITSIGRFIRRLKIDELPQLICVFTGQMSLIGPRPCLPELASEFNESGRKRLSVRPGCSGLAQVNGNIHLSWPERWKYDAYYVDHVSFSLDVKIALKTLWLILKGEERFVVPFDVFIAGQRNGGEHG